MIEFSYSPSCKEVKTWDRFALYGYDTYNKLIYFTSNGSYGVFSFVSREKIDYIATVFVDRQYSEYPSNCTIWVKQEEIEYNPVKPKCVVCPSLPGFIEDMDSVYMIGRTASMVSWYEGRKYCQMLNGTLPIVTSQQEYRWIVSLLLKQHNKQKYQMHNRQFFFYISYQHEVS